jgi:CRP/FNR family transcriptional regulator, dissimilatory nitrate respiration regulator
MIAIMSNTLVRSLSELARHEQQLAAGAILFRAGDPVRSLKTVAARVDAWMSLNDRPLPPKGRQVAAEIGVTPEALYRELADRRQS